MRVCGPVVQLVRMPPCHGGDHGFKSHSGRHFIRLRWKGIRRHSQVVRPRTANPLSPVRLWVSPPNRIFAKSLRIIRSSIGTFVSVSLFWRHSQVVRPRTANPLSPVRLWVSPPAVRSPGEKSPGFFESMYRAIIWR